MLFRRIQRKNGKIPDEKLLHRQKSNNHELESSGCYIFSEPIVRGTSFALKHLPSAPSMVNQICIGAKSAK